MSQHTKQILIIEDEKPIAKALKLKLAHEGLKTHNLFNGEMVIEALKKDKFDLIICDLVMPKKDGFQVLEEIRSRKISIPIIVLTNLSQDSDQKKAMLLGANEFIIKSNTSIANVIERVKNILKFNI